MSSSERGGDGTFVQYCTQCGQLLRLRAAMAGKRLACPGCKATVVVEGGVATAEVIPTLLPADSPRDTSADDFEAPRQRRRPGEPREKPGSQKTLWIVLGCVGAVVLIVVLLLVTGVFGNGKAKQISSNNLKQLAIAMHSYNDSQGRLPPFAISDPQGRPLLSWRVALLPYIEQENLYRQFHLDEPWDSPHNIRLLDRMPQLYADPKNPEKTATIYQVFVGQGAIFHPDPLRRRGIQHIPDGSSNTLMIVEAPRSVPWTKPEDIVYGANRFPPPMAPRWRGKFLAALGDGSVREIPADMPAMNLNALITADGGEVIDVFDDFDDRRRPRFP